MKKTLLVCLMVCIFVFSCIPAHGAAFFTVHVKPAEQNAVVGDTVYYSVVAEGEDVVALQFDLEIPEGMRYVPGSAATPKGLKEKLGVAAVDWTELSMRFTYYNDVGVNIPRGTVLLTFACTAEAVGSHQVMPVNIVCGDSDFMEFTPSVRSEPLRVCAEEVPVTEPEETTMQEPETEPTVSQSEPNPGIESTTPTEGTTDPTTSAATEGTTDPTITAPTEGTTDPTTTAPTQGTTEPETTAEDTVAQTEVTEPTSQTQTPNEETVPAFDPNQESGQTEPTDQPLTPNEETVAATDPASETESNEQAAPTEEDAEQTQSAEDTDDSSGGTLIWLIPVAIGVAVIAAVFLLLRKKRQ